MCNGCGSLMWPVFCHPVSGKGICRSCAHLETGHALQGVVNTRGQQLAVYNRWVVAL